MISFRGATTTRARTVIAGSARTQPIKHTLFATGARSRGKRSRGAISARGIYARIFSKQTKTQLIFDRIALYDYNMGVLITYP